VIQGGSTMTSNESSEMTGNDTRVFQLNDEAAEFEELELDPAMALHETLNSDSIIFFITPSKFRAFIWAGQNASVRMQFIAANAAAKIRDKIGPAIKISTVEEGEESHAFKIMVGLEQEKEFESVQTGPSYAGKAEDEILLENLSLEKILLTLEKIGTTSFIGQRRQRPKNIKTAHLLAKTTLNTPQGHNDRRLNAITERNLLKKLFVLF